MAGTKPQKDASSRKAYTGPTIREFGTVGVLTQAGSGMANESVMDMTPMFMKRI